MKNRIKECRKAARISQAELGDIVGLTDAAIGHYELGKREPTLKMWERLAKALHVNLSYLVGWTDAK